MPRGLGRSAADPADESAQTLTFLVSNDNNGLFTASGQPAIAPDGRLTFTPRFISRGTTTVTVSAMSRTPNLTLPRCSLPVIVRARERAAAR